jgi:hypothetical protein
MGNVAIREPTRQIKEFSAFSVNSALGQSPSSRCVTAVNDMQIFGNFWQKRCYLRTPSLQESV